MRTYLRALEIDDYKITSIWRNDQEVTALLGGNSHFISFEREKRWIEQAMSNDLTNIRLAICLIGTDKLIGMVNLTSIEFINRKAEFSIIIGDKCEWGKGYAEEATRMMLEFGFEERNLERIYLTVDVAHKKAIALYEKIGFTKEGLLRKDHFKNGSYKDAYLYSILRDEYRKL